MSDDPRDTLRKFLDDQGMTQGELAQELHVDPKTVSRWLTGGTTLTDRKLRRVFLQLQVDPAEYGLCPIKSAVWADDHAAVAAEAPPWFRQHVEHLDAQIRELHDKLDTLLTRPRGR